MIPLSSQIKKVSIEPSRHTKTFSGQIYVDAPKSNTITLKGSI